MISGRAGMIRDERLLKILLRIIGTAALTAIA